MIERIKQIIHESIDVKSELVSDKDMMVAIHRIALYITQAFHNDKKVLFCGNGGSASDAQHIAAELSGRFYLDRPPLFAEALHVNSSFVTAVANDYGYDKVYERAVNAVGKKGDILFALSTSGNSVNIINAVLAANKLGMTTIGMTGKTGGKLDAICQYKLKMPSIVTPRIQEAHILVGHILCEIVEDVMFGEKYQKKIEVDSSWTLFLDRDGVINQRIPGKYIKEWSDFHLIKGVPEALNFLDLKKILVTNQQGISKGIMTEKELEVIHDNLLVTFRDEYGVVLDKIYHCSDLASSDSSCRKPKTGMALQAKKDFPKIDFSKSIMVGDSISDMEFGKRLGMKTVFVEGKEEDYLSSLKMVFDLRIASLAELPMHLIHKHKDR